MAWIAVIMFALIAGGSNRPGDWYRDGTTKAQYRDDIKACRAGAETAPPDSWRSALRSCMTERGYRPAKWSPDGE